MESEIKFSPSFSTLFVKLSPKEEIIAEADAMISMDSNVAIEARMVGGILASMGRSLFGGESLFLNRFYLKEGNSGEVVLSKYLPGEICCVELNNSGIYIQPKSFLAYSGNIKFKAKWAGFKSWIAKEGMFRLYLYGKGKVWFGAYGGIVKKRVKGEYIVDTSHLIAYEPNLKIRLQFAGGFFSSIFSKEGLITRLEGRGDIYIQTRSFDGLVDWLSPMVS